MQAVPEAFAVGLVMQTADSVRRGQMHGRGSQNGLGLHNNHVGSTHFLETRLLTTMGIDDAVTDGIWTTCP